MIIKVRFFASLRDQVGHSQIEIISEKPLTVAEAWQKIADDSMSVDNILSAVNHEHCEHDFILKDGDELAFFPPVTGG